MNISSLSNIISNVTALIVRPTAELAVAVNQSDETPLTNTSWVNIWAEQCQSTANGLMTQAQVAFCEQLENAIDEMDEDDTGSGILSNALVAIGAGLSLGVLTGYVVRRLTNYRQRQAPVVEPLQAEEQAPAAQPQQAPIVERLRIQDE